MVKRYLMFFIFLIMITATTLKTAHEGANFKFAIKTGTNLPRTVVQGSIVSAYYTITNNIGKPLPGFAVKYYPANVSPANYDPSIPDLCPADGSRPWPVTPCTVELYVYGPIQNGTFSIANGSSITEMIDPSKKLNVIFAQPDGVISATPVTLTPSQASSISTLTNTATNGIATITSINVIGLNGVSLNLYRCPNYPILLPGETCGLTVQAERQITPGTGNMVIQYIYGINSIGSTEASIIVDRTIVQNTI